MRAPLSLKPYPFGGFKLRGALTWIHAEADRLEAGGFGPIGGKSKITMNEIRSASKDWFERDKQRNLDTRPRARDLLDWIRDSVIEGRRARAFLLGINARSPEIEFLFDERLLHIARRSYSAQDEPGVRYRVWKVDFGCFVDSINTARNPAGFLGEDVEVADGGNIEVPEDDYRAVRRAIFNLEDFERAYIEKK